MVAALAAGAAGSAQAALAAASGADRVAGVVGVIGAVGALVVLHQVIARRGEPDTAPDEPLVTAIPGDAIATRSP